MPDSPIYRVPASTACSEQVIKQSRFISVIGQCDHRDHAGAEIANLSAAHPKANHVCWAFIAGPPGTADRGMSDDGEPRGTAGKPMLTVLDHSGYGEIWAAVIRYFGGTKLGKGGLIRAYTSSVQQALALVETIERQPMLHFRLHLDYNLLPLCESLLLEYGGDIIERVFTERVTIAVRLPESAREPFRNKIIALSNGAARFDTNE